jgi:hypothetical protein
MIVVIAVIAGVAFLAFCLGYYIIAPLIDGCYPFTTPKQAVHERDKHSWRKN